MTKLTIKKISFSTYIKFAALFGASTGLLFVVLFLLMLPILLLSSPKEELLTLLPMFVFFLLAPLLFALPFVMYGVISYPFYILICKVFKKFTVEVEFLPINYPTQQNNMTEEQYIPAENDNNTNQGVEE